MNNNIPVITDKKALYDKCENMEQLFDKYYLPLLDKHYSKVYRLQQENEKLNHYKLLYQKVKERNDKAIEYLEQEPVIEINGEFRNIYSEDDNKLLDILKGNNETKE